MRKILCAAALACTVFTMNSCSTNDDNEPVKSEVQKKESNAAVNSLHSKELYLQVLNSKDQFGTYSALGYADKALVWQGKLDDFIENSDLDVTQLELVNRMKTILSESFFEDIKNNFDSGEIQLLEIEAMQKLGSLRAISLLYMMENDYKTAEAKLGCFWCDNEFVSVDGPCEWTNINGHWYNLEPITTKKIRFWVQVGEWSTYQPCSQ